MSIFIAVGVQWGDEGKGKIVDAIASSFDWIVRGQGGPNAGHSVSINGKEFFFHLIPSGATHPEIKLYIGAGAVIDPISFYKEVLTLEKEGVPYLGRLFLSPKMQVILPFHRKLDGYIESLRSGSPIGTTKRGMGPVYADKALRFGVQLAEWLEGKEGGEGAAPWRAYFEEEFRKAGMIEDPCPDLPAIKHLLSTLLIDDEELFYRDVESGKRILLEGAQGALLDMTHGTYPYVTSSHTTAAGVLAGVGLGPTHVAHTIGICKAYTTRVGAGPFPTELNDQERALFPEANVLREIGVTTGRQRSIGWFDAVCAKRAMQLNGATILALTKLDILDDLETIKICVGYEIDGKVYDTIPSRTSELERAIPIYEEIKGWKSKTTGIRNYNDLPDLAKAYISRIEHLVSAKALLISVGPARDQMIYRDEWKEMVENHGH